MDCPVCKKHAMSSVELVAGLPGIKCGECSGVWIDRTRYEAWRATMPGDLPEPDEPVKLDAADARKAKICPHCRHLLLPYRVGHGLSFAIDYCGACGGVWCDSKEWDAIKARNLHDNLQDIVSKDWQAAVRQAGTQEAIEQVYVRQLGPAYAKAKEIRDWLHGQPQKGLIMAYLADPNSDGR